MRRVLLLLGVFACVVALTRTAAASLPSGGGGIPWGRTSIEREWREHAAKAVPPTRPQVVAEAPFAERLPAVPPSLFCVSRRAVTVHVERRELPEPTASYVPARVRRHVPRMESGDP